MNVAPVHTFLCNQGDSTLHKQHDFITGHGSLCPVRHAAPRMMKTRT